jgi:hypothetical protein
MKDTTFFCDMCKQEFEKGRSDEEALEEAKSLHGDNIMLEDPATVCHDCWLKMGFSAAGLY